MREFNRVVLDELRKEKLWERRGWIGGYEMGIAFPPDWVGNFVVDPLSDLNADRVLEPGTCINYEHQFFLPHQAGQYFTIESLLFTEDGGRFLGDHPFELLSIV